MRVRWLNNCCSFKILSLDPDNSKMIVYEHVPLNDIKFYGEIVQWLAVGIVTASKDSNWGWGAPTCSFR
jgi:hypothetical protein